MLAENIKTKLFSLPSNQTSQLSSYSGSSKKHLGIKIPDLRKALKEVYSENKEVSVEEFEEALSELTQSKVHDEFVAAGLILDYFKGQRRKIDPFLLEKWLERAEGWEEVDAFCQGKFKAEEILENWEVWEKLLFSLAKSKNVHKRRASLVLMVAPVGKVRDERLLKTAFDLLKIQLDERDPLITKAISWLLRAMARNYRQEVEAFLEEFHKSLPRFVIREVERKLETGKKS